MRSCVCANDAMRYVCALMTRYAHVCALMTRCAHVGALMARCAHVCALMTRKSCAVGMRNAILRNYLKEAQKGFFVDVVLAKR